MNGSDTQKLQTLRDELLTGPIEITFGRLGVGTVVRLAPGAVNGTRQQAMAALARVCSLMRQLYPSSCPLSMGDSVRIRNSAGDLDMLLREVASQKSASAPAVKA